MAPRFRHLVLQLSEDDSCPGPVAGVEIGQLRVVIATAHPADSAQIGTVRNRKIVERAQQVRAERVPQPQLGGRATAEELADVEPVGALGRGGQTQKFLRRQMVEISRR